MRLFCGLVLVTVALAGFVLADGPSAEVVSADPVRQFQHDQRLIQALVEGGLRLAAEEDALKRADTCNGLADQLARAIQQAAAEKDGVQADALGHYLEAMLVRGVASNVNLARSTLPPDSPREAEMQRIGKQMTHFTRPAEEGLRQGSAGMHGKTEPILEAIHQGQAAVEKAIKSKKPSPTFRGLPGGKKPGGPRK